MGIKEQMAVLVADQMEDNLSLALKIKVLEEWRPTQRHHKPGGRNEMHAAYHLIIRNQILISLFSSTIEDYAL